MMVGSFIQKYVMTDQHYTKNVFLEKYHEF